MNPEDSFFFLTSNASKKPFTRDNPCAFSNHIPTSINFEERWYVCVWSLCATSKVVQENVLEDPPGSMFVYTDMVTDMVIGDVTAPLLAVIPLPAKTSPDKFTPGQLAYHRVRVQHLTDISIKLADLNGKDIDFDGNKTIVVIKLHFRRAPL